MNHLDNNPSNRIAMRKLHIFKALGLSLAYDIDNLKIFRITALAADIFEILRNNPDDAPGQLEKALSSRYSRQDIGKTFKSLFKAGLIGPEAGFPGLKPGDPATACKDKNTRPGGLNKLVLAICGTCNLRCKYCLSTLEPGEQGQGMTPETGRKAIDLLLRRMNGQPGANIVFYGGEPLLNFNTLKEIFSYARQQAQLYAKTFTYTVITNGTLLTPEIMDFLAANCFTIGLSLDGGKDQHDANRVYPNGEGSHDRVIRNYRQLIKRNADVTPQAVLSSGNPALSPDVLEVIRGFQRDGVVNYKLIPCMRPDGDADLIPAEQFQRMVATLLEESGHLPHPLPIDMFQMMNNIDKGQKSRFSCSACSGQLAVSADGGVYPCDNFLYTGGYRLGSIDESPNELTRHLSAAFSAIGIDRIEECKNCWARYLCGGPCPYYSQRKHGRIDKPVESFCRHKRDTVETTLAAYVLCKSKDKDFIQKWVKQRFDYSIDSKGPDTPGRSKQP